MQNKKKSEPVFPRIYTLHSQKGGVGKTSIAIAIAGFAAIFHGKNTLIIDADLTGTSLIDVPGFYNGNRLQYFNDLLLATPGKFAGFTPITSGPSKSHRHLEEFYQQVPEYDYLSYMPSCPASEEIFKIIPLISQEDFLHFFKHRLEDIIVTVLLDQFEVIIIDHPPGLFGISKASLNMMLENCDSQKKSRLNRLILINPNINNGPHFQAIMVTSPDPVDYRALLPSLSWVLFHEENIQLESNSEIEIDLIVNRAGRSTGRFDPAIELKKILNDFKEKAFPDGREIREELYTYLYERGKKFGALACRHVPDFNMEKILLTIIRLKEKKFADYKGMEDLCRQIGKIAGLYEE